MPDQEPKPREYRGKDLTVMWRRDVCIHSGNCSKNLIAVFNPKQRPWVNMQGGSNEEIIKTIEACPSKALSYRLHSQNQAPSEPKVNDSSVNEAIRPQSSENQVTPDTKSSIEGATQISVQEDGPYIIRGHFIITDANQKTLDVKEKVALCRCGGSRNKPLCDGTHNEIGFLG